MASGKKVGGESGADSQHVIFYRKEWSKQILSTSDGPGLVSALGNPLKYKISLHFKDEESKTKTELISSCYLMRRFQIECLNILFYLAHNCPVSNLGWARQASPGGPS